MLNSVFPRHPPIHLNASPIRHQYPRQNLHRRTFSRSIRPDVSHQLPAPDLKRHPIQRLHFPLLPPRNPLDRSPNPARALAHPEPLAEIFHLNLPHRTDLQFLKARSGIRAQRKSRGPFTTSYSPPNIRSLTPRRNAAAAARAASSTESARLVQSSPAPAQS